MLRKSKGFTLIELLIVVAIIGILAALLIPNAITAMQKANQKGTMKDIISITTAAIDYATDNGEAPDNGNQDGALTSGNNFTQLISPFYIKICPITDNWGNAFQVHAGTAASNYSGGGITAAMVGEDDIVIQSFGRRGVDESYAYVPASPESGLFTVSAMADFENDLVCWNGSWIRAPRVGSS